MACISVPLALGVATSVAGAAGAFSPGAPQQGNVQDEQTQALQAQINLAPKLFQSQSNTTYGEPAYAQLNLQNLNTILNGVNGVAPGLLEQNANAMTQTAKGQSAANRVLRENNISDVRDLGPAGVEAMNAADPAGATLLAKLNQSANEGLDAGSGLTGDQTRTVTNAVNASNGARGVAYGPAGAYATVIANSAAGNQMQLQRQQTAGTVLGQDQSFYAAPYQSILNTTSTANTGATNLLSQGNQLQPGSQFNPDDPNAAAIYSNNLNTQNTYRAANSGGLAMQQGITQGISGLGSMFSMFG